MEVIMNYDLKRFFFKTPNFRARVFDVSNHTISHYYFWIWIWQDSACLCLLLDHGPIERGARITKHSDHAFDFLEICEHGGFYMPQANCLSSTSHASPRKTEQIKQRIIFLLKCGWSFGLTQVRRTLPATQPYPGPYRAHDMESQPLTASQESIYFFPLQLRQVFSTLGNWTGGGNAASQLVMRSALVAFLWSICSARHFVWVFLCKTLDWRMKDDGMLLTGESTSSPSGRSNKTTRHPCKCESQTSRPCRGVCTRTLIWWLFEKITLQASLSRKESQNIRRHFRFTQ